MKNRFKNINKYIEYYKKMDIEEKIAKDNNWSIELTKKIIYEYERFLFLKSTNPDLLPSDKIEKIWKFHVLMTENYYNYCNQKFNKIIHMDWNNMHSIGNYEKLELILKTIKIYKNTFGNIVYPEVWVSQYEFNLNDLEKMNEKNNIIPIEPKQNPTIIPLYNLNRPLPSFLKLFFRYSNEHGTNTMFNSKIIDYKYNLYENYENLKREISLNIKIPEKNIRLVPHPDIYYKNFLNMIGNELNPKSVINHIINVCDFVIVEVNN